VIAAKISGTMPAKIHSASDTMIVTTTSNTALP
jgi:hypothetical protein